MKSLISTKAFTVFTGLLFLGITSVSCSPKMAFNSSLEGSSTNNQTTATGTGIDPTQPVVCQPFQSGGTGTGGSTPTTSQNGIQASLTYLPLNGAVVTAGNLSTASFQPGSPEVVTMPNAIILNELNIYPQDFSLGFQTSAGYLKDAGGNILTQYFSLHIPGTIMLNAGDTAGDYEFGLLTDDGAVMKISDSAGKYSTLIDADGTHSNELGCATSTVSLAVGKPLNFNIDYYQGPADRLALVLVWRKGSSVSISEPNCGVVQSDPYYFANATNTETPVATSNWTDMMSRGWSVVPAANFYLPAGTLNSCPAN